MVFSSDRLFVQLEDMLLLQSHDLLCADNSVDLCTADAQNLGHMAKSRTAKVQYRGQRVKSKALGIWALTIKECKLAFTKLRRGGAFVFRFGWRGVGSGSSDVHPSGEQVHPSLLAKYLEEEEWYKALTHWLFSVLKSLFAEMKPFKSEYVHQADVSFYMVCRRFDRYKYESCNWEAKLQRAFDELSNCDDEATLVKGIVDGISDETKKEIDDLLEYVGRMRLIGIQSRKVTNPEAFNARWADNGKSNDSAAAAKERKYKDKDNDKENRSAGRSTHAQSDVSTVAEEGSASSSSTPQTSDTAGSARMPSVAASGGKGWNKGKGGGAGDAGRGHGAAGGSSRAAGRGASETGPAQKWRERKQPATDGTRNNALEAGAGTNHRGKGAGRGGGRGGDAGKGARQSTSDVDAAADLRGKGGGRGGGRGGDAGRDGRHVSRDVREAQQYQVVLDEPRPPRKVQDLPLPPPLWHQMPPPPPPPPVGHQLQPTPLMPTQVVMPPGQMAYSLGQHQGAGPIGLPGDMQAYQTQMQAGLFRPPYEWQQADATATDLREDEKMPLAFDQQMQQHWRHPPLAQPEQLVHPLHRQHAPGTLGRTAEVSAPQGHPSMPAAEQAEWPLAGVEEYAAWTKQDAHPPAARGDNTVLATGAGTMDTIPEGAAGQPLMPWDQLQQSMAWSPPPPPPEPPSFSPTSPDAEALPAPQVEPRGGNDESAAAPGAADSGAAEDGEECTPATSSSAPDPGALSRKEVDQEVTKSQLPEAHDPESDSDRSSADDNDGHRKSHRYKRRAGRSVRERRQGRRQRSDVFWGRSLSRSGARHAEGIWRRPKAIVVGVMDELRQADFILHATRFGLFCAMAWSLNSFFCSVIHLLRE